MKDSKLDTELLISPRWVFVALLLVGGALSVGAELFFYPWLIVSQTFSFLILLTVIALTGNMLLTRRPGAGRWFAIFAVSVAVHFYGVWLQLPGSLAWAVIPTAFASTLVGIPAAALTAIGETFLVLILAQSPGVVADPATAPSALVAIWAIFLAMAAVSYEIRQQAKWFAHYFSQAQRRLEEARNQRADLVQALDDLAHANRQLALMNQRVIALQRIAEEAQKAKTSFVARVSHEFRTPLNMIIGLTDLIVERPEIYDATLSPRMREALRIVHRNSQHLSDMVNDVLDLSRLETDHLVLHRERVALRDIVDVAVEAVRPLLESKKLTLCIEILEDVPEIYCDRTRIEQVVLNLVSNAVRYTDQGKITIGAIRRHQSVCVRVTDTGQGIAPNDRVRIFEPFAQGTSTLWRDKGGSGLGLSISKQFIERHDGRIWVESALGVGTTFAFELPISSPLDNLETVTGRGHKIQEEWIWRERRSRPKLPDAHLRPRIVVYDETGDLFNTLNHFSDEIELVNTKVRGETLAALRQAPAHAVLFNLSNLEELHPWIGTIPEESKGTPIIGCSVPRTLAHARTLGLLGQLIKPVTRANLAQAIEQLRKPIKRVLVVDDGPDEVELLSQMLRAYDGALEIITAQDGKAALEKLRTHPPDLMLLDIVMPKMDGWQVLEAMASNAELPKAPTLFVSAQDPDERPPRSNFMVVATEDGLSLTQLLRASLLLAELLLQPEGRPDQAPG
ncbi:MAG: hybrid sensor histidine kinase/response regulator [Caldilineaceae bacterium]